MTSDNDCKVSLKYLHQRRQTQKYKFEGCEIGNVLYIVFKDTSFRSRYISGKKSMPRYEKFGLVLLPGISIRVFEHTFYWVTQKLPQICTVMFCIIIGKVA